MKHISWKFQIGNLTSLIQFFNVFCLYLNVYSILLIYRYHITIDVRELIIICTKTIIYPTIVYDQIFFQTSPKGGKSQYAYDSSKTWNEKIFGSTSDHLYYDNAENWRWSTNLFFSSELTIHLWKQQRT